MLCSSCGHNAVEVTAKFCSQCGHRLNTQPAKETADPDRGVKSTEASLEGENNYERKRPSEESTGNQKKKRKKKKKSKKKTEAPVSSEAQQVTSDLSHISLTHGQTKKRRAGRRSSDSDSFASATYDVQDSLHDGPSSLLHDGPSSLLHDGPSSLLHDGPSSLHDGPSSLHDGPSSLHDGPSSLESQSHSSAASTGASPSAVEPGESVTGESGVQRASVTSKTTRMGSPANVSAKTSSSEGNVSAKMSSSEGNMSAKTSSSEGNLSAKTDGSEGNVSARTSSSEGNISAKTSSSEGNISAKTSSSEGNISAKTSSSEGNLSAKTDSAKTSSSEGNISAKKSSSEGNISAKTSSSEGYVSAQTSSSEGNISAQTSSSEGNISAKTDSSESNVSAKTSSSESNVSAKTSSSESNENSKISSSEGNENSKISSSEGNENRKISSSESNKNAKISSSEGNENAKISSSEGNENSKISSSEGNENSKISSSEGNKNSAPQSESGDWTMVTNQRGQKTEAKSSKTKKNKLDQNANVTQNANQTEQDGPKQTGKTTGPQSKGEAEGRGSTVDPGVKLEHMEVQGSAHGAGDAAASTHPKEQEDSRNEDAQPEPPPKRITRANKPVAPNDRLTIYFHAVLSKDFKFDPEEDQIFLRAGDHIGTWDENTVELSVSKDLGEHGFLIEGNLTTTKTIALTVSIPYKYVVYKMKGKGKYEYEYIYKLDSSTTATTNRCLFVKQQLLNEEGDWHQYDDIICTEPSKNMLKRLREAVWPEQRKRVIQGREIAGVVMLETIFDLLRSWSEINLKSFLNQLNQFVHIYGNPTVYEETHHRWSSLNYGVDDVKALVKEFMVDKFIPQVLKDGGGKSHFLQDPLLAAVITLCVWKQQGIRLESSHLSPLCTALCLPRHDKEDLLKYWADFSHAVSSLKTLPEALVGLINTVKDQGMPRWILVLPLLHLLKGTTKPFQPTPLSVNSKTDALWAGLQGLKVGNPASLSSQEKRAMLNVMKTYSHLVEVDVLTGRSWMCLMPLEELVNCSVIMNTELLDMLHVFNLRAPQELSYASHKGVTDTLTHIQERLVEQKYRCLSEAYGRECLATAVKLLEKVCKGVGPKSYSQDHTDLPVACMHLVASVSDFACSHDDVGDRDGLLGEDVELLSQAMVVMREWIGRAFREALLSRGYTNVFITLKNASEAEIWNNVISFHFKNEDFTKKWRQTFMMDFEGKFKKEAALDQVEFYCSRIEDLAVSHPHVASTVEKCALEAVAHLCQTKSEGKLFERFKINGKFGTLISTIIQKSWPRDRQGNYKGEEEVVLQHILSWTAAKDIFQLHGAEGKLIEKLTLDARERIAVAISSFSAITKQLVYGTIKINLLNFILEKKQSFLELVKIDCLSEDQRYRDEAPMRRLLQLREQEVTAVLHEKELLDVLLAMSHKLEEHITVDVEDLEERHHINVESMTLDRFMEVHPFEQPSSPAAGVVTYFNLDEDIRSMAQVLHTFRGSFIFKLCWEEQARILATADADDDDGSGVVDYLATTEIIYEDIFRPCYAKYEEIYRSLKSDSIKLREVDKFFKDYKDKYEELAQDLDVMCRVDRSADKRWIPGRVQQIAQYHELHLAVASAQIIMTVKETLCLQGDFKVLQTLLEVTHTEFKMECLSRIDNDLMQAKAVLVDITEPRRLCLQELGRRRHFVNWVKEALEDINELKVFVDLASIYAGENDLDVDRVACFHDAVLGYSSLLYGLKPDSGFPAFQEALKKLWRALDNDSNLPKKLCDTSRHLEWLKTVKDSHGSVELSSLSLAAAVNSKGIYVIGAQDVKKLSLDTALKLQIPEEHEGGQEMRRYSLEDMRDLQNKLMLMSGKGDQGQNEVEHFVEVFSGVQRLAEAIIALYTAGNPLFRHLEVHINCSSSSQKPSILMDFNLTSVISVIILEGNVEVQLPELCRKMEKCLDYWMDFVDKQRSLHYYLNYYTAEQIVYLCSKLSRQNVDNLEDQVLMMLSFVKPNCESSDLRQVWHALQYKMLSTPQEINEDIDFQTFVEVPGCSQEGPDVTGELDSLPSLMEQASGSRKFDLMWNSYMKDMKNFLPHILDTRSLGRLLEILANREDERDDVISQAKGTCIKRDLPKGLAAGNPNLIVCPHDEVLTSCISIYMSSERELLPTYDEVLLCSPATPYEQVELFLRRCLTTGYRGRKIYTLLYGDQLTYDVSSKVETFFQRMKLQSRNDYRLVMICSSDREHAYLPSAFSQYRLHMVPQEPLARIQKYLGRQYSVPADQGNAGAVFKDGLCVGVVASKRAGVGKSLYIKRLYKTLKHSTKKPSTVKCIRLIEPKVDESVVLQSLLTGPRKKELTIFHFDVTSSVKKGLDEFLFKLLVLHYLMDSEGRVWKCSNKHLYVIEILQSAMKSPGNTLRKTPTLKSSFMEVFPTIFCRSPKEVQMRIQEGATTVNPEEPLMDHQEFQSEAFQRPYQYLTRFHNHCDLDTFAYHGVEGSPVECLQMLLLYCGVMDPSWAELRNFAWFLNLQLRDCETSVFCDFTFTGDTLMGFKHFVVDFMIMMAKDFATPSLSISDQSPGRLSIDLTGVRDEDLAPFRIRKKWESEPHPYIFFNDDHVSMTFIGFHLRPNEQGLVDAIDPSSGAVIKRNAMTKQLYEGLQLQRVPFNINFDELPRADKIERLCNVLGIQWPLDPDETYELTTDNILKMLAIHMRFRCGIPVIIMGETGCGKTRLIKFLCELRRSGVATENMKLVKVHGGTTSEMVYTKIREAEAMALTNTQDYQFDSVLFFDEANTTEAISSIKEVLCDKTVAGEQLSPHCGLQIIAACNPYRKHTDEMIQRLESAGLGYRVRAEDTDEKLGSIPLRQLVYRVQSLPPSMIPLVWDFGQLNDHTEKMYIQQIVQRVVEVNKLGAEYNKLITDVLSTSQRYMRTRKDECSFVSLRDVERCMQTFVWFYKNHVMLFAELERFARNQKTRSERKRRDPEDRDPVLWSLIMSVGVCYHACLENKDQYRLKVCKNLPVMYSPLKVMQEILLMQDLLLSGVPLGDTIARNGALKENVFMMVLCIELRIPLFLVGKPGSSKSLSKTLVADAMQGQAAHSELYKRLKQIHLVSFQCSPHSTPEGIINTFKQCGRFQEGKNLKEYISVVVLDEIGLAEDSPKMPLKTLHPLLEEGCIDDEPLPHKKVGFIGISNWALDPAKMNRGIFVSRGDPDERELIESAKGICSSDPMILEEVRGFFQPFARAYLAICRKQGKGFFGLRDYYSLIKMIFAMAKVSQKKPSAEKIVEAVLRNFSGRDDVDAVSVFTKRLQITPNLESINAIELVRQNISAVGQEDECRYLLVLTKNYVALQILQQTFFSERGQPEIIFGSSFPKDQEYTQICRNINRVKICMETGQTVVLLNLQNLYESLYDALNQYYVCLGGQKYVDLGLGTHRVKCRVHKDFRLIVIEEKEVVYKQFPIPLINRLEKHYLDIHTVLKTEQKRIVEELERWVVLFVSLSSQHVAAPQTYACLPPDVFIGYHSDTCASVVLQVIERQREDMETLDPERRVLEEAKLILLNCATPDSVVRLDCTGLPRVESEHLAKVYFENQSNSSLADFILAHTHQDEQYRSSFTEVTTFSRLLTASDLGPLEQLLHSVELLSLQQFDTEQSFLKKIRHFLSTGCDNNNSSGNKVLIIQSDFDEASHSANLIASAKYSAINEINKTRQEDMGSKMFVFFITKLPRMEGGTSYVGFHGGPWRSVHIDDLRRSKDIVLDIKALRNLTIGQLFEEKANQPEAMDVDDMYSETEPNELQLEHQTGWDSVLDTTALVRSCVQSAVGTLRDQAERGFRSTRRVEILLALLSDNQAIQAAFLRTLKRRLHSLLVTHDGNNFSTKSNWVIKEASNIDALQEGGTFRHTLWKRVQAVVVPFLAQLVSVIDRDRNLDLLLDANSGDAIKTLWLDIFGNEKLLDVPYMTPGRNSETRTILVQSYIAPGNNTGCTLPFSWRIKDFLDELWVHALQHEGQTQSQFEEFYWKTPLGQYIAKADAETQTEFFQRYLQDFISMTMNVTREGDLKLLCSALNCCVNELRSSREAGGGEVTSLPWVHAAHHEFKSRLQNLSRMISMEPPVALLLLSNTHAREGMELVLDVYAAVACVEYLEPQAMDTDAQRHAWLRQVKRLQVPIESVCAEDSVRRYGERSKDMVYRVHTGWNRIFSLSLFVEHMLLGIEEVDQKLKPLVLEHMRGLGHVLEKNSDLKAQQAFEALIEILKACKDGAVKHIFRFGLQLCPVCMVDPHDPLSLPCGHIYCVACIKLWLTPGQMYCPLCMQPVPDDFPMEPSEHIRTLVDQHARFRKQCNAFFIDVVSTVCFKDNCPPCPAIILHLLSFLMVEADTVPIVGAGNRQMLTKTLSPFDDSVDRNPVVRSVVLKLLLKYSFDEVKGYLQQHLTAVEQSNILEETDKTELYCLYINCLEDSMFERLQFRSAAEQQACLQDESVFLGDYLLQSAAAATPVVTVDYLQQVARVRLGLDMAAGLLVDTLGAAAGAQENRQHATSAFLSSVVDLCARSGNDWYRIYLIRKICSQQGVEFVQKLVKETSVRWLFPEEVLQQIEAGSPIDQFLVCGQDYKTIRDAVAKAVMKGKVDGLEETCEGCRCLPQRRPVYLLLALFREVTSLYRHANAVFHPKPEQCKALLAYIQTSRVLASPEMKAFAQALVHNQLGQLAVAPGVSGAQAVVVELSIHLATVLVCGREGILAPLQQLAMTPANMQRAFLPSMPEDIMAVARQAMGETLQWYRCPNGHPCTIGECGKPVEMSRCLDCGVEIGGINHVPVAGFQRSQLEDDRTQTGHILGNPRRRDNPDMLDTKDMSPVSFNLVRLLTHMALLLGATKDAQHISAIIKPPVPDPGLFLFGHLLKDMKHLTRSLGKGTDDTVNAVHLVISSLQEPCQGQQWPVPYDNLLSTKEARTGWEMSVSNNIITSQLKHLDRRLKEANAAIRSDSRVSSNPIITLMFGDPHLFLASLPAASLIHGSAVWSCREKVSLLALTHVVEQNDGRDTLPVLWRFLQREAELRLVKFLPDILTLQRDLVKKFQNVTDLPCRTIAEFLHSQTAAARNAWYEKCINIFLTTWNQLRVSLATNGEIKIPGEFCQQDLDLSSDFQVLLPRRQGPGLCSTALVGHLISLHNDMVQRVAMHTAEQEASYTVSPADLTELHVIRYEPERDLVPLVLSCSQYSMERGQEMLHEYHLHKIQRQVLTRFLQGKPLITLEGIPTLVNRHDRNYETILKDVKERVRQESLPALTLSALAGELQSYSEVCEALSTVEVALGFLAMTGGDAHTQLSSYLQEVLQMGDQTGPHILKALSVCSLQHCVALWQLLTSLKSENMLRLKRDPFSGVSDEYRGALGEEERRLVTGFFSKSSADAFLLELHEFLLLVLKNPRATDTYRPGWGLRDTLVSYMERKDLDVPPDVQEFPEQVTLSQCIDAWRFTVALKHERGQR